MKEINISEASHHNSKHSDSDCFLLNEGATSRDTELQPKCLEVEAKEFHLPAAKRKMSQLLYQHTAGFHRSRKSAVESRAKDSNSDVYELASLIAGVRSRPFNRKIAIVWKTQPQMPNFRVEVSITLKIGIGMQNCKCGGPENALFTVANSWAPLTPAKPIHLRKRMGAISHIIRSPSSLLAYAQSWVRIVL